MTDFTLHDCYVLNGLHGCGFRGMPFHNYVIASPMAASDLLASLRKLEGDKLLMLSGPRTLADFERLLEQRGPLAAPVVTSNAGWTASNCEIFKGPKNMSTVGYFDTKVRLTLRGHYAALRLRVRPTPVEVAVKRGDTGTAAAPSPL